MCDPALSEQTLQVVAAFVAMTGRPLPDLLMKQAACVTCHFDQTARHTSLLLGS